MAADVDEGGDGVRWFVFAGHDFVRVGPMRAPGPAYSASGSSAAMSPVEQPMEASAQWMRCASVESVP